MISDSQNGSALQLVFQQGLIADGNGNQFGNILISPLIEQFVQRRFGFLRAVKTNYHRLSLSSRGSSIYLRNILTVNTVNVLSLSLLTVFVDVRDFIGGYPRYSGLLKPYRPGLERGGLDILEIH